MYSRLSNTSRNQRSKGTKVKHILQICLLVAVCFWLVYQVKRSHDKRKEFDENDANLVSEMQHDGNIPRLGRKDISRVRETVRDEKLHGEEGEENDVDEEENKHEEGEQEREESRTEDREEEDTGKGGEGDEIDKHEEEKTDDENHEEIIDAKGNEKGDEKSEDDDGSTHEDKDTMLEDLDQDQDGEARHAHKEEDNEEIETVLEDQDHDREARNTDKEDNEKSETVLEGRDQDHDREPRNTHEAREEHYKADDASSEVVHDTKTVLPDTVNATLKSELVSDGKENASENSTTLKEFNDQSQTSNNSTQFESEHSIDTSQAQNATYEDSNSKDFNKSMSLISSANVSDIASDKNQLNVKTEMNDTHHVISTSEGSLSLSGEVKSALAENTTISSETKVDAVNSTIASTDKDMDSDSENVIAEENDTSISEAENENDNAGDFHDPVEDIDSSLTQEEKEYRTDLGTLPDIKVEVENAEDVEAE